MTGETREPTDPPPTRRALLVDGHVHFHSCFSWDGFLNAAAANFARGRRQLRVRSDSPGCLCLTEIAGADYYRVLADQPDFARLQGWRFIESGEEDSVVLTRGEDTLIVIAGRQIVTAENLELLAVGCREAPADGLPICQTLHTVANLGAVPIVPWGFGKWLGQRARTVYDLLVAEDLPGFCLGDNGGRIRMMPSPRLFSQARRRGIPILPGSDPLDIPTHVRRPGSYGFALGDWEQTDQPAEGVKMRIRSLQQSPSTFGTLSSLAGGLASQFAIRWRKLTKPGRSGTTRS